MTKKTWLVAILALALALVSVAGVAESADDIAGKIGGVWYITQIVSDGVAYDVSQSKQQTIMEFKSDNTGYYYVYGDEENKNSLAWTADDNGNVWFTEEVTQETRAITFQADPNREGETIMLIGDEMNHYVLTRVPSETVDFATIVKAENADVFNGHYALTYLAGDGYTIKAANALEDLSSLGIKTTEITIDSSLVELFGNDPRAYVFNEENGTLNMEIQDNIDFLNIHIFKTETGIAINWLDLTFYADPIN